MEKMPQILPQFDAIQPVARVSLLKFRQNCAYLLEENDSVSAFIEKIGRQADASGVAFDFYNFFAAYNLKFPTTPATVALIDGRRMLALGISSLAELLQKICENAKNNLPLAVFLSIQERTPEEMLRLKRNILQQFIYLRMYLPIIIEFNAKAAIKTLHEILNSKANAATEITFIGTKKSGKSSLINAILGAEYSPSSSELPTPNKVSYAWSGAYENFICAEYEGRLRIFEDADELREFLTVEFLRASKTAAALKPMCVNLPQFPENLRDFVIVDTPGSNFAASKEHAEITESALKNISHCIFVMNYSAHLTNDEIKLFDSVYRALNNNRRHQTLVVAVNRIDEMYAADVIKSYERFADYIRHRLNTLGYENIVVVSISAITAVYIEKVRQFLSADKNAPLETRLKNLRRKFKGSAQFTVVDFVEKALNDILDFHGVQVENLDELKKTSRVGYLMRMIESIFDPAEQFEWFDEMDLSAAGTGWAMYDLACDYRDGRGVEQNFITAADYFDKAADAGMLPIVDKLGSIYYELGICTETFYCRKKAAESGDVESMNALGDMYHSGRGTAQDFRAAAEWYLKAAENGHARGMYNLACNYRDGEGVQKNINSAVDWFKKAADAGIIDACRKIGGIYFDAKNFREAMRWYKKGAELGNDAACLNQIGVMYYNGQGVTRNHYEAVSWYRKAADAGSVRAMNNLGACYYNGNGVKKNIDTAREFFYKAADLGDSTAMFNLGKIFHLAKNYDNALSWYKKALADGNSDALKEIDAIEAERNKSDKSDGCFITTAVFSTFGKPDDCAELTAFRNFRDGWLMNQPDGKKLVEEYYSIAPEIVRQIDSRTDSQKIYRAVWDEFLSPCLEFIERGENLSCKRKYVEMVRRLQQEFI